jgi:plastocyanin
MTNGGTPADASGTLTDEHLALTTTSLTVAATLRIRGVNQGAENHTIAIRQMAGSARICGTPNITPGTENTFAVSNLPPGTYQIYCTIHPSSMQQTVTVG